MTTIHPPRILSFETHTGPSLIIAESNYTDNFDMSRGYTKTLVVTPTTVVAKEGESRVIRRSK